MTTSSVASLQQDPSDAGTDHLIRRLSTRYFLVLAIVAALVIVDQAIVQPLLVRMNSYAPAINLAGRQRMLSQRLAKAALALQMTGSNVQRQHYQEELRTTLEQWSSAHSALRGERSAAGLPSLESPDFDQAWSDLKPHFEAMLNAGNQLAGEPMTSQDSTESTRIADKSASLKDSIATIVAHEADYLSAMERIVALLEQEAARQMAFLRGCAFAISVAIILLLLGLGWYVVRPATRAIRGQVEQLESQVDARTRQLALANDSLRREILERQSAEVKNRTLAAQLSHAARISTMGHFAAALAHEINQPLATIVNYAETCELDLAEAPTSQGKLRKQIEHIRLTGLRAGQIVRRIRNFVRPNVNATPVEADLNALVAEVVDLCRYEAHQDEVAITVEQWDNQIKVAVDPIQIQQVLVNLLQNSFQAMQECPREQRRLSIATNISNETAVMSVCDSGPGINIAGDSLFEPFATTKLDGLGIGLWICRTIVESHGGQIWVEKTDVSGTTICLSLPLIQNSDVGQSEFTNCVCR